MRFTNETKQSRRAPFIAVLMVALPIAVQAQLAPPTTGSTTGGSQPTNPRSEMIHRTGSNGSSSVADQVAVTMWLWLAHVFSF